MTLLETLPELTEEDILERSPFLARLKKRGRLAPSRYKDLLAAAKGAKKPKEPESWECCGSSCKPCVKELWKEELKGWEDCHPDGEEEEEEAEGGRQTSEVVDRVGTPKIEIGIEAEFEEKLEKLQLDLGGGADRGDSEGKEKMRSTP
ncbi:hypothetical protein T439DRAFT_205409 [Meredithblackwellia eburnea MCA 4105]